MHYVAIDPSPVHTAVVQQFPNLEWYTGPPLEGITEPIIPAWRYVLETLKSSRLLGYAPTIVIERPPQTPRGMTIESQQTIAAYWFMVWNIQEERPQAKIISLGPGSWKPAAKGWKIEYPSTLTDQHQRDAYAMLQVHLATKGAKR
jgi:hypothetical protein